MMTFGSGSKYIFLITEVCYVIIFIEYGVISCEVAGKYRQSIIFQIPDVAVGYLFISFRSKILKVIFSLCQDIDIIKMHHVLSLFKHKPRSDILRQMPMHLYAEEEL